MVFAVVGTVVMLFLCMAGASYVSNVAKVSSTYAALKGAKASGTSSSDITSSETSSTNRELKGRMERFERRLQQHKMELEAKEHARTSTDSASENQYTSEDQSSPTKESSFPKQLWFAGSNRWKQKNGMTSGSMTSSGV